MLGLAVRGCAAVLVLMLVGLLWVLAAGAMPSVKAFGWSFVTGQDWRANELEVPKRDAAGKVISGLVEFCKAHDAELLVTTSRRTPKEVESLFKERFTNNKICRLLVIANERNMEGAVAGILDLSNIVTVSGESVSMVSESIHSGKKVVVFDLEKKKKAVTKYDRVLADLEGQGYISRAIPADLGAKLEKAWKAPGGARSVDDREKPFEAVRRLI